MQVVTPRASKRRIPLYFILRSGGPPTFELPERLVALRRVLGTVRNGMEIVSINVPVDVQNADAAAPHARGPMAATIC